MSKKTNQCFDILLEGCLIKGKAKIQNGNVNNICQREEAFEETSPKQLYENPVEDNLNGKDMILLQNNKKIYSID